MAEHTRSIEIGVHGVAYNYHWDLEYIKSSFTLNEISQLLDDAVIFNPWVSKKEPTSDEIPEDEYLARRKEFEEQRKEWEQSGSKRS